MKDALLTILTATVPLDENERFDVAEDESEEGLLLKVFAPKSKMGMVIGKGGKTINAIKNVLKVKAIKENKRIEIEVLEQE